MKSTAFLTSLLLLSTACGSGGSTEEGPAMVRIGNLEPLPPPAPGEGVQLTMKATAKAGEETWKCLVLDRLPTTDNAANANISRAVHRQTPNMHHMDLMVLATTGLKLEPGMHDCETLYDQGDNLDRIMDDGVILYASQRGEDEIVLPKGVVAEAPVHSQYLFELHYINTTDKDEEIGTYLNAYFLPDLEVTDKIWGGPVRDRDINVPARAKEHIEWTRCEMNRDVEVIFLSSHSHELAHNFEIFFNDGEGEPRLVYENRDWQTPFVQNYNPPLVVKKGQGFEFRCHYSSTRDRETNWGNSAQDEMCQIAIVHTPFDLSAECEIVESGAGPTR